MKAYWYDNIEVSLSPLAYLRHLLTTQQGDQRLPHDSGRPVTPTDLSKLGIICHNFPSLDSVNELASSRNYKNRDEVTISPTTLPNYEEKVKIFFHEHLHEDEEIRYILDGAGYFDVRSEGDDWIRLRLEKGDLAIMPAGIYHRFTTDDKNVSRLRYMGRNEGRCADDRNTVHQGHETVQGRAQVDAAAAWCRDRREQLQKGVSEEPSRGYYTLYLKPSQS